MVVTISNSTWHWPRMKRSSFSTTLHWAVSAGLNMKARLSKNTTTLIFPSCSAESHLIGAIMTTTSEQTRLVKLRDSKIYLPGFSQKRILASVSMPRRLRMLCLFKTLLSWSLSTKWSAEWSGVAVSIVSRTIWSSNRTKKWRSIIRRRAFTQSWFTGCWVASLVVPSQPTLSFSPLSPGKRWGKPL